MGRRGRPPFPELLTPREQEVLGLLREGLTNPQIAERLAISLDGAKYHVSQIMGKLGVSSREDAARWRPGRPPRWAGVLAPLAPIWRRATALPAELGLAARVVSGVVLLGAMSALVLLVVLLMRTGASSGRPAAEVPSLTVLRERAVAAVQEPGMVFHATWEQRAAAARQPLRGEAWIDVEGDIARIEGNGPAHTLLHRGSAWYLDEQGRFSEMPYGYDHLDIIAPLALEYMRTLLTVRPDDSVDSREMRVDDRPALRIQLVTNYDADGYDATQTTDIYLEPSFLPIRMEEHTEYDGLPDRNRTIDYEYEFVPQASLSEEFFSLDALRQAETTPADSIAGYAERNGLTSYWLGEEFEGLTLTDARAALYFDTIPVLELIYKRGGGGPNDPPPADAPPSGVSVAQFATADWEAWSGTPSGRSTILTSVPPETLLDEPGMRVRLYEDPNFGRPAPNPLDPLPLTPLPDWLWRAAVVETPNTVILIEHNIGPWGERERASFEQLAVSFRPFEPPE